jgi:porphobilinogen synthase
MEAMLSFKRAGADGVLTYFARDIARRLKHMS